MSLSDRIQIARGETPAALLIKNTSIFHLTTGETEQADIAIDKDGIIAGIGTGYTGERVIDAAGMTAVPGFIDAHVHVESSLMLPWEFERCVLRHGVTTAVCDPHELANVVGTAAFDFFFAAARCLTMALETRLSSCVPATHMETAGAAVSSADLKEWHNRHPEAALAEYMNVPGVLYRVPECLEKVAEFDRIDGHCPLLGGKDLNAYVSAGIRNDHECSLLAEAKEKLLRGMQVFIREGSAARNLETLAPLITVANSPFVAFCTDDRNPLDMQEHGHIDRMIARAIAAGAEPLAAYRAASWSPAQGMGFGDRGLIAPGRRADIVLLSDLADCKVERTIVRGIPAEEIAYDAQSLPHVEAFRNTVKCRPLTPEDFPCQYDGKQPVIGAIDGSLMTDALHPSPNDADVLPLAVIERHGKNGNIATAFVHGFGLQKGAIASSVGHDSHNICVVGTNAADMAVAANALRNSQGGFAAVCDGKVTGLLPLPLAGLFSDKSAEAIIGELTAVREAVKALGCRFQEPFLQLAFLPLPVIPHLKLTDMGLVDVDAFKLLK